MRREAAPEKFPGCLNLTSPASKERAARYGAVGKAAPFSIEHTDKKKKVANRDISSKIGMQLGGFDRPGRKMKPLHRPLSRGLE